MPDGLAVPNDLRAALDADVAEAKSPYERALTLEKLLHDRGYFSDGGTGLGVAPGHGLLRLGKILQRPETARGDGEQYAAAMALAARALGMPARVVMGFAPAGAGHVEVHGADVSAWVEIAFDRLGWVAFSPTPEKDRTDPRKQPPQPRKEQIRPQVPPLVPPHATTPDRQATQADKARTPPRAIVRKTRGLLLRIATGVGIGMGMLFLLFSPVLAILFLKLRRRRARRALADPASRIVAGWQELLDTARDSRRELPGRATRVELAQALGLAEARPLAQEADRAVFAAQATTAPEASAFWDRVALAKASLLAPLTGWQRLRSAASLTSLKSMM